MSVGAQSIVIRPPASRFGLWLLIAIGLHAAVLFALGVRQTQPAAPVVATLRISLEPLLNGRSPEHAEFQAATDHRSESAAAAPESAGSAASAPLSEAVKTLMAEALEPPADPPDPAPADAPIPPAESAQAPAVEAAPAAVESPRVATSPAEAPAAANELRAGARPAETMVAVSVPEAVVRQAAGALVNAPEPAAPAPRQSATAQPLDLQGPVTSGPRLERASLSLPERRVSRLSAADLMRQAKSLVGRANDTGLGLDTPAEVPRGPVYLSPNARSSVEASYVQAWIRKVEAWGARNFPAEARRRGLAGSLTLDVALNADGSVRDIALVRSSGHQALDQGANRIVKLASPFAPFPAELRKRGETLHIVRTWQFLQGELVARR